MCSRYDLIDGYIKACIHYALCGTMAALALLEDVARKDMEGAELQRPARSTGQQWGLADGPSVREEHLQKPRRASPASSAHNTQVSTGTFQRELADRSGISQPAFSRVMPTVLEGIIGLSQQYIKFLYTVGEQANKNAQFAARSGFPNIIGTTNCIHVVRRAPNENELVRHRCPPPPPSPRHSGGIPWWSLPVVLPAGELRLARSPARGTDALPVWRQALFLASTFMSDHFTSLRPHSDLLRQQHLHCLPHAANRAFLALVTRPNTVSTK